MKVRTKIVVLLLAIVALFVVGLFSIAFYSYKDIQVIQNQREQLIHRLFKSIVALKGQPIQLFSYYYSHWNEMGEFAENGDPAWAEENLDPAMSTYHAEAIWVFDRNLSLTHFHSTFKDSNLEYLIEQKNIPRIFGGRESVQYYEKTKFGIMEIRGAAISKANAPEPSADRKGYFFIGHIWDDAYIKNIADAIEEGHVTIVREEGSDVSEQPISDRLGNLYFTLHFLGWDGKFIQNLRFEVNAPFVKKYVEGSVKGFLTGSMIWFGVFLFIAWSLIVWVNKPLKIISLCLLKEDAKLIQGIKNQPTEFGRICRLIEEFFQQKEQLKFSAHHDALTGILNRGAILDCMDKEMSRTQRQGQPFSIIMADLDHFKQINDTYGHLSGDLVLKEVANRLHSELRTNDWVGRYGGEEFLIVSTGCDSCEAQRLAERLKSRISDKNIELANGETIFITTSIGIASFSKELDGKRETLIARADAALYQSKRDGRDRITVDRSGE